MHSDDIAKLYDQYVDSLYRFFFYKVQNKDAAQDLVSDTYLQFAEAISKGKVIDNPAKFLYGIAKNVFIRYLQQKYRQPMAMEEVVDFASYTEEFIQEVESYTTAEEAALPYIEMLPDKQREVITLRLIEKLSLQEIADKLGKNMNYVKTTQKRGLKSLRQLIASTPTLT